jgi:hypothetical protein
MKSKDLSRGRLGRRVMNALLPCMKKEMSTLALVNAPLSIRVCKAVATVTC